MATINWYTGTNRHTKFCFYTEMNKIIIWKIANCECVNVGKWYFVFSFKSYVHNASVKSYDLCLQFSTKLICILKLWCTLQLWCILRLRCIQQLWYILQLWFILLWCFIHLWWIIHAAVMDHTCSCDVLYSCDVFYSCYVLYSCIAGSWDPHGTLTQVSDMDRNRMKTVMCHCRSGNKEDDTQTTSNKNFKMNEFCCQQHMWIRHQDLTSTIGWYLFTVSEECFWLFS